MSEPLDLRRFIGAGLVAGLAINIFDGILYAGLLASESATVAATLGLEQPSNAQLGLFAVMAFAMGFTAVWLYVGVRARLGASPATAAKTGLAVWLLAYLVPFVGNTIAGTATTTMFWVGAGFTIISVPLATMAGAWVYRGAKQPAPAPAGSGG